MPQPLALDDSKTIQQLSAAAARTMENSTASSESSHVDLVDEEDLIDTGSSIVSYSKADKLVASKNDLSESDTIRGKHLDL